MYKILLLLALAFTTAPVIGAQQSVSDSTIVNSDVQGIEKAEQDLAKVRKQKADLEKSLEDVSQAFDDRDSNQRAYKVNLSKWLATYEEEEQRLLKELELLNKKNKESANYKQESANN